MCLIKVNQVETSLESISQRFYWAFSPSNVDTYFHCFQILVRTKIMELSLAGILIIMSFKLTVYTETPRFYQRFPNDQY